MTCGPVRNSNSVIKRKSRIYSWLPVLTVWLDYRSASPTTNRTSVTWLPAGVKFEVTNDSRTQAKSCSCLGARACRLLPSFTVLTGKTFEFSGKNPPWCVSATPSKMTKGKSYHPKALYQVSKVSNGGLFVSRRQVAILVDIKREERESRVRQVASGSLFFCYCQIWVQQCYGNNYQIVYDFKTLGIRIVMESIFRWIMEQKVLNFFQIQ